MRYFDLMKNLATTRRFSPSILPLPFSKAEVEILKESLKNYVLMCDLNFWKDTHYAKAKFLGSVLCASTSPLGEINEARDIFRWVEKVEWEEENE